MKVQIDSLVRGKAGFTDKMIEGRVYQIHRTYVAVIDAEGHQWVIYEPEVVDKPRPLAARTNIPSRLR